MTKRLIATLALTLLAGTLVINCGSSDNTNNGDDTSFGGATAGAAGAPVKAGSAGTTHAGTGTTAGNGAAGATMMSGGSSAGSAGAGGAHETGSAECTDKIDNDGNGFIDCEDNYCCDPTKNADAGAVCPGGCTTKGAGGGAGKSSGTGGAGGKPAGESGATECADGLDNDGNGYIDCADFGCCKDGDHATICPNGCLSKGGGGATGGGGKSSSGGAGGKGPAEGGAVECADGVDNDGNGYIDCADFGCCKDGDHATICPNGCLSKGGGGATGTGGAGGKPPAESGATECADGVDNDKNGYVDCEDFGCCKDGDHATICPNGCLSKGGGGATGTGGAGGKASTGPVNTENTAALCANGTDDDGDGKIDCADLSCKGLSICSKEITDPLCSDGLDNDSPVNNFIDCADFSCLFSPAVTVCSDPKKYEANDATCADGLDNDSDTKIDCADFGCCQNPNVTVCPNGCQLSLWLTCTADRAKCVIGRVRARAALRAPAPPVSPDELSSATTRRADRRRDVCSASSTPKHQQEGPTRTTHRALRRRHRLQRVHGRPRGGARAKRLAPFVVVTALSASWPPGGARAKRLAPVQGQITHFVKSSVHVRHKLNHQDDAGPLDQTPFTPRAQAGPESSSFRPC